MSREQRLALLLFVSLSLSGAIVLRVGSVAVTVFLIAFAIATPALVLAWKGRVQWSEAPLLVAVILFGAAYNSGSTSWVSVVYSMIFVATFVVLTTARSLIPRQLFASALKVIIVAYFVNVVVAQLLVASGAPDDFLAIFSRWNDVVRDDLGIRYYGFSSEPSYAAFIVLTAFVALLDLRTSLAERDVPVYGALVAYQVIAFNSIFGYVLGLAVVGAMAYRVMSRTRFVALVVIALSSAALIDYQGQGRFGRLLSAVFTEDIDNESLGTIDTSLFMRVAPIIEYVDSFELSDPHFYFGHGPGSHEAEYTNVFWEWLDDDVVFQPSYLPAFAYDFGLAGALVVLMVIGRVMSDRRLSLATLFLALLLFNANFNTQLFWFVVIVFGLTKSYREEDSGNLILREVVA